MEAKISVIIPAYNVADFLPACLESVLTQSLRELEVILVDDGSTDDTPALCDRYAQADDRVRVIHKKNEGVSRARNAGIEAAGGIYYWFVDADDIVMPGACDILYGLAAGRDVDAVIFDYCRMQNDKEAGTFPSVFAEGMYEGKAIIPMLLRRFIGFANEGIHDWLRREPGGLYVENPALWRMLVRGDLIRDNHLRFDPTLRVGEDTVFISLCLSYAERVWVAHRVLYCQRLHAASTVARYEKNPESKHLNKIALLSARRALTRDIALRRGADIGGFWQGNVVMSYMELCFLWAHPLPGIGYRERYRRFLSYAEDPHVAESLQGFLPPDPLSARALPFWLMKRRMHGVMFLCAALLGLTPFRFNRE